ncbi:DNA (cytosine-5-)-methyltransferase [Candidatus Epulonipiscioides gigas]|nr:DNA (cytosine-5-)-methyltransferase [Epulopiscium sp. SCG-C07WGA-EpuloA2]
MNYNVASLFAGVGGICLGFKNAGANIVWANEMDKWACETYKRNFTHTLIEAKIEDVDINSIPNVDILTSGFPCTSFSIAGYQKGFEDEKSGHLFMETLKIIKAIQPQVIFLENVKNLLSHDKGNTFKVIKEALVDAGYFFKYQVLNSMEYGNVPQNRERIYIVGFKNKNHCDMFNFPKPIKLTKTIRDIINPTVQKDSKFYYENSKYYPMLSEVMKNRNTVYQLRRVYVRENKNNVSPTLTANMGTGGHNVPLIIDDYGLRKLTPKECFMFQGFPEDYQLPSSMANSHLYKQAGNSVTVPVVERIAKNILDIMNKSSSNIKEQYIAS